jgi:hypothetical protein
LLEQPLFVRDLRSYAKYQGSINSFNLHAFTFPLMKTIPSSIIIFNNFCSDKNDDASEVPPPYKKKRKMYSTVTVEVDL